MEGHISDVLDSALTCLKSNIRCGADWTRLGIFAVTTFVFISAGVVFAAIKALLEDKVKAGLVVPNLAALVLSFLAFPSINPFLGGFVLILSSVFMSEYHIGGIFARTFGKKISLNALAACLVIPAYFIAYGTERFFYEYPKRSPAVLIMKDPDVGAYSEPELMQLNEAVASTRRRIVDSFNTNLFTPLPAPDQVAQYEKLAWREVGGILGKEGLFERFDVKLAIGGSLVRGGAVAKAVLGELQPDKGFMPVHDAVIKVEGAADRLPPMLDLLSYKIAKRILQIQKTNPENSEQVKGQEEAVVKKFQIMLESSFSGELRPFPALAVMSSCHDFRCADEVAVALAQWLKPAVAPAESTEATAKRSAAAERIGVLLQ